ncbi:MAG: ABC transporter permease [Acidimicrobiales bacterium]
MATVMVDAPSLARPRRFGRVIPRLGMLDRYALVAFASVTLLVLFAPYLAPHDPTASVGQAFQAPGSSGFLAGTDESGRDILSRLLYAGRSTWFSVIVVLAVSVAIGALVGTIAGAAGGVVDSVLMRITDMFLALPGPLLAIAVAAALGRSLVNTLVAITIVWWPWYARIVRNEVKALGARPHLEAARLAGAGRWRLSVRHLLPGALPPLIVTSSLDAGALIVTIATLSFFGLGSQPPAPELGSMTFQGVNYLVDYWWIPILPALGVFVLSFVATLFGDALRAMFEDR